MGVELRPLMEPMSTLRGSDQWIRSIGGRITDRENSKYLENACTSTILSSINTKLTVLETNPGLRDQNSTTTRMINDTAIFHVTLITYFCLIHWVGLYGHGLDITIPSKARDKYLFSEVSRTIKGHTKPPVYQMGTGNKVNEVWNCPLTLSAAVKNELRYTSTPPYTFECTRTTSIYLGRLPTCTLQCACTLQSTKPHKPCCHAGLTHDIVYTRDMKPNRTRAKRVILKTRTAARHLQKQQVKYFLSHH
jgi:hypothetical protein